jgi:hypothetical protein
MCFVAQSISEEPRAWRDRCNLARLGQLSLKFVEAQVVKPEDPRLKVQHVDYDSPKGYGKMPDTWRSRPRRRGSCRRFSSSRRPRRLDFWLPACVRNYTAGLGRLSIRRTDRINVFVSPPTAVQNAVDRKNPNPAMANDR